MCVCVCGGGGGGDGRGGGRGAMADSEILVRGERSEKGPKKGLQIDIVI